MNIGLNDWAKQELNDFCVSMLTEHEEIMEEMAVESSKDLGTRMCKNELKLCEDIKPKKASANPNPYAQPSRASPLPADLPADAAREESAPPRLHPSRGGRCRDQGLCAALLSSPAHASRVGVVNWWA